MPRWLYLYPVGVRTYFLNHACHSSLTDTQKQRVSFLYPKGHNAPPRFAAVYKVGWL